MRSRASPILAVLSSLFLLSNHDLVVAQAPIVITAPSCTSDAVWQWVRLNRLFLSYVGWFTINRISRTTLLVKIHAVSGGT